MNISPPSLKRQRTENATTINPKIALLCHGRKHKQYASYYKTAVHIDHSCIVMPDIVHDLSTGMPQLDYKFDLIQTVHWPQLHRFYFVKYTQLKFLRERFNIALLKSIAGSLNDNGFFVFCHNGHTKRLIGICRLLGLKHVAIDDVQKSLNIKIYPNPTHRSDSWATLCFQKTK
jgi:hypothetical protein